MTRTTLALSAAATVFAAAPAAMSQQLPTDPSLVTGTLDNGMKYVVRRHANPAGRAAMWIQVGTGSLNETDKERGISHYLEHMAFNGSENFPAGTVINFFQSMGLNFGRDQNAFTSFDQTTYQLAFPDNKPETIEKGMLFFADVAGRLSLLQTEVESERQVILEEKRSRSGANQRLMEYVMERIAPGSIVGQRMPIGVEETLLGLNRDDFVNYYSKWYVPSNMTLMVVADADPLTVVEGIRKNFSFGDKSPTPPPQDPRVKPTQGVRAIVATDAEYTQGEVSITILGPKEPPATTRALARRDAVRQLATSAFNRRMGAKLDKGGTAYLSAYATARSMFNTASMRTATAEGKPEDWRKLLTELGEDIQRARLHGFSQQELDDVKKEAIAGIEQFVAQESTMPARVILARMNSAIAEGEPLMSAQQELELYHELTPTITREDISTAFAELFDTGSVVFTAQLPTTANPPTDAELVSLGQAAFSVQPDAQADEARATALLDKLPEPGTLTDPTAHAASAVSSAWLGNGARYHHRFMDIRKEQATITITLAAGNIQETDATRGVSEAAGIAWGHPATSKLSSTNIRELMTGSKARARGGVGMDEMSFTVSGNPSDLEEGMKLAYLMLTDPIIEPSALDRWKKESLQAIEARRTDPRGAMQEAMADTLFAGCDSRTRPLTAEQVNAVTLEAAQAWLTKAIAAAPIEVAVVGDIEKSKADALVARYVGSLPRRERIGTATLDNLRALKKTSGPHTAERRIKTATPLALVVSGFYGADMENVVDTRCMQMCSRVLSTRMIEEIREKRQLAYSPNCAHRPGVEFPGFGVFMSLIPTEPAKADLLAAAVANVYDAYSKDGATEDELNTVRKQIANTMDEQMKEPGFWTGRLSSLEYRGIKLDDVMTSAAEQQTYTAQQLKDTFNKYYKPDSLLKITIRPAEGDSGSVADEKPLELKPAPQ